ncbi:MAG: 30S ribosomal protein S9 [Candidatus Diapherotrites archaeon]|nr:30S ribosomal protein S9 [Candidatus Diapherotrites archaeon]
MTEETPKLEEIATVEKAVEEKTKTDTKKRKTRKKSKAITTKAKKKKAVARAVVKPGKGRIRVNSVPVELQEPEFRRMLLMEPVYLVPNAFENVDISVTVNGGGTMGQSVAIRGAIAKAIVAFTKDDKIKQKFLEYNRNLLIDDSRRKEAKKPLGRGARAKKQLSKR